MKFKLVKIDHDYDPTKVVTNHIPIFKKTGEFTPDGVYSERIFGKMPSTGRDFACECGKLNGKFLENVLCNSCNTPVLNRGIIFDKKGWIDLKEFYIIAPLFYSYISRIISKRNLEMILQKTYFLATNGDIIDSSNSELINELDKSKKKVVMKKYWNIGIIEFMRNWKEIIEYYANKSNPKTQKYIDLLYENEEKMFVNHLPIFSTILRPAMVIGKKVIFNEINSSFNILINTVKILHNQTPEETNIYSIEGYLWKIQTISNNIFRYVLKTLNSKKGYIRSTLLGVRINFSSRCVITPLKTGYLHDEVVIPYLAFLELYKFHIINILMRDNHFSMRQANDEWKMGQTTQSKQINNAIVKLLNKKNADGSFGIPCLINRNPTIAFGSILKCRIVNVKTDIQDKTMSVCNNSLKFMNGDYDGDVIAIIALLDDDLAKAFDSFNPCYMTISRDGFEINRFAKMSKDHVLGISILTEK